MTQQELYERHKEVKCKNCTLNCEGITITVNNTTVCQEGELKNEVQ